MRRTTTLVLLLVVVITDVSLPSTLGTIPGPECHVDCSFGLVAFFHVWSHYPYFYGESSADFFGAACLRAADVPVMIPRGATVLFLLSEAACRRVPTGTMR
jgi:hypothetical protein